MESKYKERAEQIVKNFASISQETCEGYQYENVIEAMCQLAEEVEKHTISMIGLAAGTSYLYTKEQVEELLQKQRELCADKAFAKGEGISLTTKNQNFYWTFAGKIGKIIIDKDSILNAKLKLE